MFKSKTNETVSEDKPEPPNTDSESKRKNAANEVARRRAVRRLIEEQRTARANARRNRHAEVDDNDDETLVTLLMPERPLTGIAGFINYALAHPLLILMAIDAIVGIATRKRVPPEVPAQKF